MVERKVRVVPAERAGEFKLVCLDASPIDCLLHAKRIDRDTYEAGEIYAETWERSGLRPTMSASYDRQVDFGTPISPFEAMSLRQQVSWRQWARARRAMPSAARQPVDDLVLWWRVPKRIDLAIEGLAALAQYYADQLRHDRLISA